MGENYRIDGKHVGKASGMGRGNGYRFIWDMPPREFLTRAVEHAIQFEHTGPAIGIIRESPEDCHTCPTCDAIKAIMGASAEDFDSIGQDFS